MEVKNNQPQNIDWGRLTRKTDKINQFLQDLTPDTVGDGRMMYNEGEDALHSRSSFFKGSRIVQYIATIGTKGASFDETRDGFAKLQKKCQIIHAQIATYKPQTREDCSRESV